MDALKTKLLQRLRSHWPLVLLLVLVILTHIPHITTPPLDLHSWRQTDTMAVSRNFENESANLFMPRIDMRGANSGVTGMEFPLYNYIVFLFNIVVGFAHWHGRLVTLLFSLVGLAYFWGFAHRRYNKRTAYLATVSLSLMPLWFFFSRNIQPDVFMVSLAITSLYYGQTYVATGKKKHFYLSIIALSLACLVKIPAVFVALPLAYIFGYKRIIKLLTWKNVSATILIMATPTAAWYIWSAHLSSSYGLGQYFYGELSLGASITIAKTKLFWSVIRLYVLELKPTNFLAYMGILFGLVYSWAKRDALPVIWCGSILVFLVIFANKSFYHNYYSLPLMPGLALLMALGMMYLYNFLKKDSKVVASIIIVVYLVALARYSFAVVKPFYTLTAPELTGLENIMNGVSDKSDLIVTNYSGTPMMLYFANRKGWSIADESLTGQMIKRLKSQGAKYIVRRIENFQKPSNYQLEGATQVKTGTNLIIYKIN